VRFIFHPEALQEYEDSFAYYAKISPGLASSFVKETERSIGRILDHPEAWPVIEEDVHRHLTNRFPFGVYYTIEPDHILILAIMHMSRQPGYWKNRLTDKNKKI
jgi:toxin ParE1/3/4